MRQVFHIVSNHEWGGGEQYVYDLAQRQKAEGWQVCIFCRPIADIIQKFHTLDIDVHSLPLKGVLDMTSALYMSRILKKAGKSATVHAHNFKDAFTATYARKISGRKDVRVVMCRHLTRKGKNSLTYRWLYRQIDAICFDSHLSEQIFLSTHPSIDPKKLHIVHTSIVAPPIPVLPAPIRQEFGIADDTIIAMYHGRLDPEKGLDILMEATRLLNNLNFRLVLIGRGSNEYTNHLKRLCTEYNIESLVIMAGFRHPVLPYTTAADFGLLPSTVQEGCPLSPLEYMSQGRPVITTDNGGQREYIKNEKNGLLVQPGNANELAQAMRRLISNAGLRIQLGRQAKSDFDDHLNYSHFYHQIMQLYQ